MSTFQDIADSKVTVYIKPDEGFFVSTSKTIINASLLILCIYISQGNAWWTFFTGAFFLLHLATWLSQFAKENYTTFNSKQEAIAYLLKTDEVK